MTRPITKSVYVEFLKHKKLARRHRNNKKTYKKIQEYMYGGMDGISIGQSVEDLFLLKYEGAPTVHISSKNMFGNRYKTYHKRTISLLKKKHIIVQPAFVYKNVFVKCDFLVPNTDGTRDILEIKAKNSIYKKINKNKLLDDLVNDISIQHRVVSNVLGEKYSGNIRIGHLNKEYVLYDKLDIQSLTKEVDATTHLLDAQSIESTIEEIQTALSLSEIQFNVKYPYSGTDYMIYFGEKQPKKSIRSLPRASATKKLELYQNNKIRLKSFGKDDIENLKNNKGEETKSSIFLRYRLQGEEHIDKNTIKNEFHSLSYPLYFYDYETASGPIPKLEGTHSRQQVVTQYSIHIVHKDGTITHQENIITSKEKNNKRLLKEMIEHMDNTKQGTRIVRYKGFENVRNNERADLFPEYKEQLLFINENTYDLMEVFSRQLYFHRDFEGSNSIKKVLPVLTNISYEGMKIPNGAVAQNQLNKILSGVLSKEETDQISKNLLEYCKLDTRAMVKIWQALKEKIKDSTVQKNSLTKETQQTKQKGEMQSLF